MSTSTIDLLVTRNTDDGFDNYPMYVVCLNNGCVLLTNSTAVRGAIGIRCGQRWHSCLLMGSGHYLITMCSWAHNSTGTCLMSFVIMRIVVDLCKSIHKSNHFVFLKINIRQHISHRSSLLYSSNISTSRFEKTKQVINILKVYRVSSTRRQTVVWTQDL